MRPEEAAALWPIVKAFGEGETVQVGNFSGDPEWRDCLTNPGPSFFSNFRWRIKPKPVKCWINIYPRENIAPDGYVAETSAGYASKSLADLQASSNRIACVEIEIPPTA